MTDDLQAAIGRVRSERLAAKSRYSPSVCLSDADARLLCDAIESVPVYRISEDKNAPTYSGHLHDAEFLELLVDQCGATAGDIVGVSNLGIGGWRIVGDAEGVHFKVERIR